MEGPDQHVPAGAATQPPVATVDPEYPSLNRKAARQFCVAIRALGNGVAFGAIKEAARGYEGQVLSNVSPMLRADGLVVLRNRLYYLTLAGTQAIRQMRYEKP